MAENRFHLNIFCFIYNFLVYLIFIDYNISKPCFRNANNKFIPRPLKCPKSPPTTSDFLKSLTILKHSLQICSITTNVFLLCFCNRLFFISINFSSAFHFMPHNSLHLLNQTFSCQL